MQIRTFLCNKRYPEIEIAKNEGISVSEELIEAWLVPQGCQIGSRRIITSVIPQSAMSSSLSLFECFGDRLGNRTMKWRRRAQFTDNGNFEELDKFITVEFRNPKVPCHWVYTAFYGLRGLVSDLYAVVYHQTIVEEIPIEEGKSEVYTGDVISGVANYQTRFVPGELLQVKWGIKFNDTVYQAPIQGSYFASPCFTGGRVIDFSEAENQFYYTIEVQGKEINSIPTDFADYQIGDWVYLLKQSSNEAEKCNKDETYSDERAKIDKTALSGIGLIREIKSLVDRERTSRGLSPLSSNNFLHAAADAHSLDMANGKFLSHEGSEGSNLEQRVRETAYLEDLSEVDTYELGENIARQHKTAEAIVDEWMRDPEQKENILNEDFDETAIVVQEDATGTPYYTQVFAVRTGSPPTDDIPIDTMRILPITVNEKGNENGEYETRAFDMLSGSDFERFFEMSLHYGIVKELWPQNVTPLEDAVRVEVSGLGTNRDETIEFEWVSVYYICEEEKEFKGGMAGFRVGDEVLVLNEYGKPDPTADDLAVVGHKNGVRKCASPYLLVVSEKTWKHEWWDLDPEYDEEGNLVAYPSPEEAGKAIVWDLETGKLYSVLGIDGNIVSQPINYVTLAWLMYQSVNGGILIDNDLENPQITKASDTVNEECGTQIASDEWCVLYRNTQLGELLPTDYLKGKRSAYAYIIYYDPDKDYYPVTIENELLGNQPQFYYSYPEEDGPWEIFMDAKDWDQTVKGYTLDTDDSYLDDLVTQDPDTNEYHTFLERKDPNSEHYDPCSSIGYTSHQMIGCSGDPDPGEGEDEYKYKTGCYAGLFAQCDAFSDGYYYCESTEYPWILHWKTLLPDIDVEEISLGTDIWYAIGPGEGKETITNMGCGISEGVEIAACFEYFDFHYDLSAGEGQERFFNVFVQYKLDASKEAHQGITGKGDDEYHIDCFTKAPNMSVLREIVFEQLSFEPEQFFHGEDGLMGKRECRPVLSLYESNIE